MQWAVSCSSTAGQIAPIYPDLPRADPSQILPGGNLGALHVFARCHYIYIQQKGHHLQN